MKAPGGENPIDRAAADWVMAMDRGLTTQEAETLNHWLERDRRHRGALLRAQAAWFNAVGRSQRASVPPVAIPVARRRSEGFPHFTRRRLLIGGAVAAGTSVVGVTHMIGEERYDTRRGEVRRITLGDGSGLVMNTDSRLAVRLAKDRRRVRLDNGEAWFDVAHDKTRPFVVSVGDQRVTAVGTAFSIKRHGSQGDEVLVSEGIIEISADGAVPVRVEEGRRAFLSTGAKPLIAMVSPLELQRHLAWREGLIMLDGERLVDAAAEFNRYGPRPIIVAPALADQRVVGVFQTANAEGFARAMGVMLSVPVRIERDAIRLDAPVTKTS